MENEIFVTISVLTLEKPFQIFQTHPVCFTCRTGVVIEGEIHSMSVTKIHELFDYQPSHAHNISNWRIVRVKEFASNDICDPLIRPTALHKTIYRYSLATLKNCIKGIVIWDSILGKTLEPGMK